MATQIPDNYLAFNQEQTKNVSIVVLIDGVDALSSRTIFTKVRYGDPELVYGMPGLVYGGLRPVTGIRSLLSFEGSQLTLSQRIEPEQGRASISQMTLAFLDKDEYMTQVISPGIVVDEILNREVKVLLGYEQLSYPEDYFVIFRGRISGIQAYPGKIVLALSDPNVVKRQNVFFTAKTTLNGSITDTDTTINVVSNGDFHQQITNALGAYDTAVKTYIKVEDEYIEYGPAGFGTNQFTSVTRGSRGTTAVAHDSGVDVTAAIQLEDHAIDLALKIMLSGWNGPWKENVPIASFVFTGDPILMDQAGAVILPSGVDADRDYGLVAGDFVISSGSAFPANNTTATIISFGDLDGQSNRIIYTDAPYVSEHPSAAVLAFRSQYDTLPVQCGTAMNASEVDIDQHLSIKNSFLVGGENNYRFLLQEQESGKTFIENEIYLPVSLYSLTRFGRASCQLTKPPIADDRLQILSKDNILNPQDIIPTRALNNRKFFNEIDWQWDFSDAGDFTNTFNDVDTESLSLIGISSVLPISSRGARSDLGFMDTVERRSQFLLSQYKRGAIQINGIQVTWGVGNQVEAGDVVGIQDNGSLKISNFATGMRDLGTQLFSVVGRTINIVTGNVTLDLLSGVGAQSTDRFATISPSSQVTTGSTSSRIMIMDSYGAIYPGNEKKKWQDYIGQKVLVHSDDWTNSEETTLTGFDPSNSYAMLVDPPLSFTPVATDIVDIPYYPTSVDPYEQQIYKTIHTHLDPTVTVVSGPDTESFEVAPADIGKFFVGAHVLLHNDDYSTLSPEVVVTDVDTGTNVVTVDQDLGYTPSAGDLAELIGFADHGGAYRWV